jgi:hypothetical protein
MRQLAAAALLASFLPACAEPAPSEPRLADGQRRQLYDRADGMFDEGNLLSPASNGSVDVNLAPLLIRESGSGDAVYVHSGSVEIDGREMPQLTYLWAQERSTTAQGFRVTMDSDGFPAIYEVLDDATGARLLFVMEALESTAIEQFGDPLAGRRFSIERPVDDAPDVVVAGLLEPGPVPLGPFVYLNASGDVASIICRCMESRVESIADSMQYELTAIEHLEGLPFGVPAWLTDGTSPATQLRWPESPL